MNPSALTGLEGGPQLRAALNELRAASPSTQAVMVDNGSRGPMILDLRGCKGEALDGIVPTGGIVALSDPTDPNPKTLLENGFDVVCRMSVARPEPGEPFQVTVWTQGAEYPQVHWIVFDGDDYTFRKVASR